MLGLQKQTLKRLLVGGVLVTSLLVTSFVSQVDAAGQNGSDISTQLNGQILDHQLYYFLVSCAAQVDVDKTTPDEISSWQLFKNDDYFGNTGVRGGMYANQVVLCSDGKWVQEAFSRFGFTDPWNAFCSLSFVYHTEEGGLGKTVNGGNNSAACELGEGKGGHLDGSGNRDSQAKAMETLLKSKDKGRAAALPLTPEAEYVRKYRTLMNACQISLIKKITENSNEATNDAQRFKIPVVNADGSVEWWLGEAPWGNADGRSIPLVATTSTDSNKSAKTITCGQLSKDLQSIYKNYATYVTSDSGKDDKYNETADNAVPGEDETACAVEGIGWIVCPVMNFMAGIVDAAYMWVESMLTVQPLNTSVSDPNNMLFAAWSLMRNFANICFVIAFLFIIYSQITGVGISNYGIKKLLPRIIVAAILVNISYWICAIAVDISNIAGVSIKGLFGTTENQLQLPSGFSAASTATGWGALTTLVLAGGALMMLGLSVLLPALIAALAAIVTVFLVLTLRQALIILLIVISPLAFVAYLLPNTDDWFKKWLGLFRTLLLMFPIIALIFGASALASKIVVGSAVDINGDGKLTIQIAGALISVLPLALTPIIMKTAGGVLNRFGGIVNNAEKGPFDRMRKGAEGYRGRRVTEMNNQSFDRKRSIRGALLRRGAKRDAINSAQESSLKNASTSYIANEVQNPNSNLAAKMAAGGGVNADQRVLDQALNVKASLEAEEVKAATSRIERLVLNQDEVRSIANGGSAKGVNGSDLAARTAAFQHMAARGDFEGMNQTWDAVKSSDDQSLRKSLADSLASSSNRPAWMGQGSLQDMREGTAINSTQLVEKAIKDNAYSPDKIATADKEELKIIANVNSSSTNLTTDEKQRLLNNAGTALKDADLSAKISKNVDVVDAIRTNTIPK